MSAGSRAWIVTAVFAVAVPARCAETGDFDGDGRLTIGDVLYIESGGLLGIAPGSFEAFQDYACYLPPPAIDSLLDLIPVSVFLECLRRTVPGAPPAYSTMNLDGRWAAEIHQEPLPPEPDVLVRLLPVAGGPGDVVPIQLEVECAIPIRAFCLILETNGLLRVPWHTDQPENSNGWSSMKWFRMNEVDSNRHGDGTLTVRVPPAGFLATGGRYVVTYNLAANQTPLFPGIHRIVVEARLPRGTRQGHYPVRILEASQMLLDDGSVVAPNVQDGADVDAVVGVDVSQGWDEGLPPLRFDPGSRSVLGKMELRLVDREGRPAAAGEPLAQGKPGDEIELLAQVRSATPLNHLRMELRWLSGQLACTGKSTSLLRDPETGGLLPTAGYPPICSDGFDSGVLEDEWAWGGNWARWTGENTAYPERAFEHLKPLDEWLNLYRVVLSIPEGSGAGDVPLTFRGYDADDRGSRPTAEFVPYRVKSYCDGQAGLGGPAPPGWSYDVGFSEGFIRVSTRDPPVDPPDLGVRFELADASGPPGALLELPIFASASVPLIIQRLVLELDPVVISIDAVRIPIRSPGSGQVVEQTIHRGQLAQLQECEPDQKCTWGVPYAATFRATEDRFVFLEWVDLGQGDPFPGAAPELVATLLVRVADRPDTPEGRLEPTTISLRENGVMVDFVSGGRADATTPFSPASKVRPGIVRVEGIPRAFVRGDANADGKVDLTDAVATLGYLFLGSGELACVEAADSDDSGVVVISDPIFLLAVMFLGQNALPPPFPACGVEVGAKNLGCKEGCR